MAKKQSVQALFEKGAKLAKAGDLNGAIKQFRLVIKTNPAVAEAHFQLGALAARLDRPTDAVNHFTNAFKLRPNEPAVMDAYAKALHRVGKDEAALSIYDRLIEVLSDRPKPRADKALLLQQLGRFDEAEEQLRLAIHNAPYDGELYRILLATKKLSPDDRLIPMMEHAWGSPKLTDQSKMHLGYALAKTMEDTGQHDRVFSYLEPANSLLSKSFPYDLNARKAEIETLFRVFRDWAPRVVAKAPRDKVIFVTGMPRSGTTLIEQILASHGTVTGGGELAIALRQAYDTIGFANGGTSLGDLSDAAIAGLGRGYLKELHGKTGVHPVTTDKSIQTYMVLGLMALALPNAKFVLVKRDPRDIGLSIYKNFFPVGTHRYATDLRVIGQYIGLYEQVIAFWKERVPDRIVEIAYEDVIANPEAETRALIAACGLDWEDACLSFHETKRDVKTLSLHQVRQPIYASSTKAWTRYEKELAPMIDALEESGCL